MARELGEFAIGERDRDRRSAAYFAIGKLGNALSDPACAAYLLAALGRERHEDVIRNILSRLGEVPKPADMDLSAIYSLMTDARLLVRCAAIEALKCSESPDAEARVIEHLVSTGNRDEIVWCQSTLGSIGTQRAVPAITANLKSRVVDVRVSAEVVLEMIRGRSGRSPGPKR